MNPRLTDDALADLPLHDGRAELLEEIMRTPVLDDHPVRATVRRDRPGWLVPAAAAAVIAMLAVGSAWWASGPDGGKAGDVASQPTAGDRVVLEAPGWAVTATYADENGGELSYENGDRSLEVMWGPADTYESYVEDRRHIVDPPADGAPIVVLGADAQMWAYSATDHTAIREVEDDQWIEFRGSGMREPGYLALLGELRLVDETGFEAALPDSFVTGPERPGAIDEILDGIGAVASPLLPNGVERSSIASDQTDRYQLGAEVAGAVACAWLDEYADARQAGSDQRAQRAAGILATARDWPVLQEMAEQGGFSDVIWDYARQVARGQVPEGYADGLGCAG